MESKQLENFVGPISPVETEYLDAIKSFLQKFLHESRDFQGLTERLWLEIRRVLVSIRGEMPIAEVVHWNTLSLDPDVNAPQLSNSERKFLEDVVGFVEYSLRNGLRFSPVFGALAHDFGEIAEHNYNFDAARKSGWLPQVNGYSTISEDSFGGIEEPSDHT